MPPLLDRRTYACSFTPLEHLLTYHAQLTLLSLPGLDRKSTRIDKGEIYDASFSSESVSSQYKHSVSLILTNLHSLWLPQLLTSSSTPSQAQYPKAKKKNPSSPSPPPKQSKSLPSPATQRVSSAQVASTKSTPTSSTPSLTPSRTVKPKAKRLNGVDMLQGGMSRRGRLRRLGVQGIKGSRCLMLVQMDSGWHLGRRIAR